MKGSMECKRIRHEITPCSYGIVRRCIVAFAKFKESLPVDLYSVEEGLKSIKDLIEGNFRPKLDRTIGDADNSRRLQNTQARWQLPVSIYHCF